MNEEDAEAAAQQIIDDLKARSGLGDEWDAISYSVKRQIEEKWRDIILGESM